MRSAQHVARYLTDRVKLFGDLQLQKLLYYAQGWHLAWDGRPLFRDDFQAWRLGPVVPEVRRDGPLEWPINDPEFSDAELRSLDAVIEFYGHRTGAYLSDMTHDEAPWKVARRDLPVGASSQNVITKRALRAYFTRVASEDDVPHRVPVASQQADDGDVEVLTKAAVDRWSEALELLAR